MSEEGQKPKHLAGLGDKIQGLKEKLENEPLPEVLNRPELQNRFIAVVIDWFGAAILVIFFSIVVQLIFRAYLASVFQAAASVAAGAFILARDALGDNCSPGKMLVGLKVQRTEGIGHVDVVTSAVRNATLVPLFFLVAPVSIAGNFPLVTPLCTLLMAASVGLMGYELLLVLKDREQGLRLGDKLAHTRVVEE